MNSPAPTEPRGRLLLGYTPDGPLGGTFTCTRCGAQAWQPDLLDHAPDCAYRLPDPPTLQPPPLEPKP